MLSLMRSDSLDELDIDILWFLRTRPYLNTEELAQEAGKAKETVRRRTNRLIELGYLYRGWWVNPIQEVFPYRAIVHVKCNMFELSRSDLVNSEGLIRYVIKASQEKSNYKRKVIVEDVYETFGDSDILFELLGLNQHLVARFIIEEVSAHQGVTTTTTQTAFASRRHAEQIPAPLVTLNRARETPTLTTVPSGAEEG